MKKNVMMRLASFLLVAVLISTSAISGTYAKYVTSDQADDSARVAKWGVDVVVTSDAFSDAYKDEAAEYTANEELGTITVQADTEGTKVLAPGTNGTLATVELSGTPEVDVEVKFEADVELTGWMVDGEVYCPIIFNVGGTEMIWDDAYGDDVSAFATAVSEAINNYSAEYHTNKDLSTVNGADLEITWEWPFYTTDANDEKDTKLGNEAAAGSASNIAIDMTVTVTQIN